MKKIGRLKYPDKLHKIILEGNKVSGTKTYSNQLIKKGPEDQDTLGTSSFGTRTTTALDIQGLGGFRLKKVPNPEPDLNKSTEENLVNSVKIKFGSSPDKVGEVTEATLSSLGQKVLKNIHNNKELKPKVKSFTGTYMSEGTSYLEDTHIVDAKNTEDVPLSFETKIPAIAAIGLFGNKTISREKHPEYYVGKKPEEEVKARDVAINLYKQKGIDITKNSLFGHNSPIGEEKSIPLSLDEGGELDTQLTKLANIVVGSGKLVGVIRHPSERVENAFPNLLTKYSSVKQATSPGVRASSLWAKGMGGDWDGDRLAVIKLNKNEQTLSALKNAVTGAMALNKDNLPKDILSHLDTQLKLLDDYISNKRFDNNTLNKARTDYVKALASHNEENFKTSPNVSTATKVETEESKNLLLTLVPGWEGTGIPEALKQNFKEQNFKTVKGDKPFLPNTLENPIQNTFARKGVNAYKVARTASLFSPIMTHLLERQNPNVDFVKSADKIGEFYEKVRTEGWTVNDKGYIADSKGNRKFFDNWTLDNSPNTSGPEMKHGSMVVDNNPYHVDKDFKTQQITDITSLMNVVEGSFRLDNQTMNVDPSGQLAKQMVADTITSEASNETLRKVRNLGGELNTEVLKGKKAMGRTLINDYSVYSDTNPLRSLYKDNQSTLKFQLPTIRYIANSQGMVDFGWKDTSTLSPNEKIRSFGQQIKDIQSVWNAGIESVKTLATKQYENMKNDTVNDAMDKLGFGWMMKHYNTTIVNDPTRRSGTNQVDLTKDISVKGERFLGAETFANVGIEKLTSHLVEKGKNLLKSNQTALYNQYLALGGDKRVEKFKTPDQTHPIVGEQPDDRIFQSYVSGKEQEGLSNVDKNIVKVLNAFHGENTLKDIKISPQAALMNEFYRTFNELTGQNIAKAAGYENNQPVMDYFKTTFRNLPRVVTKGFDYAHMPAMLATGKAGISQAINVNFTNPNKLVGDPSEISAYFPRMSQVLSQVSKKMNFSKYSSSEEKTPQTDKSFFHEGKNSDTITVESKQNYHNKSTYDSLLRPFKGETNTLNPMSNTISKFFVENYKSGIFNAQDFIDVAKTINPNITSKKFSTLDQFYEKTFDSGIPRDTFQIAGVAKQKLVEKAAIPYIAAIKSGKLNFDQAAHEFGTNFFGISGEDARVTKKFHQGIVSQLKNKIQSTFTTEKGITGVKPSTPESLSLDHASLATLKQISKEQKLPREQKTITNLTSATNYFGKVYESALVEHANESPKYTSNLDKNDNIKNISIKPSEKGTVINKKLREYYSKINVDSELLTNFNIIEEGDSNE